MIITEACPKVGKSGDSQHWYTREGLPAHDQPNKSKPGEFRPTTLRDARVQSLLPSVSSILGVMAKPGLTQWIKTEVAEAAWAMMEFEPKELFIEKTLEAAEESMTKARDLGTEIHGAIERYLRETQQELCPSTTGHPRCVEAAVNALKELGVWGQPFEAERTFASPLGYGGTIDIAGVESEWVFDFKAINTLRKRYDWPERSAQIAAYQIGKYGHLCRGGNILISTEEPGQYAIRIWEKEELEQGYLLFRCCFELWKCISRYDPSSK